MSAPGTTIEHHRRGTCEHGECCAWHCQACGSVGIYDDSVVMVDRKKLGLLVANLHANRDAASRGRFWGPSSHVGVISAELLSYFDAELLRAHSGETSPPPNVGIGPDGAAT